MKKLGTIHCPAEDGDFDVSVYDLINTATGYIMLRQEGQGQVHVIVLKKDEAKQLAGIITGWVD